jgi:hypothetical protein
MCQRLNATPRKCLGYRTPTQAFRDELIRLRHHDKPCPAGLVHFEWSLQPMSFMGEVKMGDGQIASTPSEAT